MLRLESERLSRWSQAMGATNHAVVYFEGRVQGVGFRYQTLRVAQEFEVSGYVQNLADGRVCVEAEGRKDEVEAFIGAVEERMTGFIRKCERRHATRESQFKGFTIR